MVLFLFVLGFINGASRVLKKIAIFKVFLRVWGEVKLIIIGINFFYVEKFYYEKYSFNN